MHSVRRYLDRAQAYGRALVERERPFFSLGALGMYALTLIAELPVIFARFVLMVVVLGVVAFVEEKSKIEAGWLRLALIPSMWSALALITPAGSAWWWQIRAGARQPSTRERLAYQDAIDLLQGHSETPLPLPKRWFVIDTPYPDAAVIGNALMLSRGLLETDHVPAVLAHELGHLGSPDGRLTAALNRMMIFTSPLRAGIEETEQQQTRAPRQLPGEGIMRMKDAHQRFTGPSDTDPVVDVIYWYLRVLLIISLFARGGLGLWLTRPAWGAYWRSREYKADQYAASLGQANELADFLEVHALMHDHPVPFLLLTEHTHPPAELRIDKLRNPIDEQRQAPAPGGTPAPGTSDTRPLTI